MKYFWNIYPLFISLLAFDCMAQPVDHFKKGTQEVGLTNLSLGYSSGTGFLVDAQTRYQYYLLNRFALGAVTFYSNFNSREWMGIGPVASYILFTQDHWFSRLDQQITTAKFNGFSDDPATLTGSSAISINYLPEYSNFFIGGGYMHTYALNDGRVIRPNSLQIFAGWIWR
jgi:hypothetical protein